MMWNVRQHVQESDRAIRLPELEVSDEAERAVDALPDLTALTSGKIGGERRVRAAIAAQRNMGNVAVRRMIEGDTVRRFGFDDILGAAGNLLGGGGSSGGLLGGLTGALGGGGAGGLLGGVTSGLGGLLGNLGGGLSGMLGGLLSGLPDWLRGLFG